MNIAVAVYLAVVCLMSLATFIAYGIDKRRAGTSARRIPERTLHLMAFFGGWPGAWIGQRQFRHKTQKMKFLVVYWLLVVLHVGIVGVIAYAVITSQHA